MQNNEELLDVAIIGGGPAGSTTATILKKYRPDLGVAVFEREHFPREHVGESLLPSVCKVLDEMGCWDAVEQAGFPIKIGATYRWGSSPDLWDFEFLPVSEYRDEPRPGRFEGIRARTAFQVDRAKFDKILLDRAGEVGCQVHEGLQVIDVEHEADKVGALRLSSGRRVRARYYVDASGASATLRRSLGVPIQEPTRLKNVAFWDYWENTEWAVSIGKGATRVLVLSLSWGWIWFIPVGPTRTSIGLVCPAEYYKASGLTPAEIYKRALSEEPKIRELTAGATREGEVRGAKDWSFVADRLHGENWFLVGETAGFADPILAAGLTLTMTGARELAHTLISLLNGEHEPDWLKQSYSDNQRARISQHIRFADFWYSANGQFSDLKEFTRAIAADAGLSLSADEAFQWLGAGGFTNDITQLPTLADVSVTGVKQIAQRFTSSPATWKLNGMSVLRLKLDGAVQGCRPSYKAGKITKVQTIERDGKTLPLIGLFGIVFEALRGEQVLERVVQSIAAKTRGGPRDPMPFVFQVLEVWLNDGWIEAAQDPRFPAFSRLLSDESGVIHSNKDISI